MNKLKEKTDFYIGRIKAGRLKQMKEEFVLFRVKVIDMIQKVPEKKHREVLNHVVIMCCHYNC